MMPAPIAVLTRNDLIACRSSLDFLLGGPSEG